MKRARSIFPLLLACILLLQCREAVKSPAPPPLKIEQVQEGTGGDFGVGARLLYHHLNTERLPGLEEWIVEAPAFDLSKQPLTEPVLKIHDTKALQAMISIRLPKLPLNSINQSEHGEWMSPKGKKIQCDVLCTNTTRLVFLRKEL